MNCQSPFTVEKGSTTVTSELQKAKTQTRFEMSLKASNLNKENLKDSINVNSQNFKINLNLVENQPESQSKAKERSKAFKSPRLADKQTRPSLQIRSPNRPAYMPSGFRSNKASESVLNVEQGLSKSKETTVIYTGLSKDGKFQVVSKAFAERELEKATQYEITSGSKTRNSKLCQQLQEAQLPEMQPSQVSSKQNGVVRAYSVNTHQGISRNYNEDRVSVILNISKQGVKSTFFAVYDGHGGTGCCDFLRDYLHEFIISNENFPLNPRRAIIEGVRKVEQKFLQLVKSNFLRTKELDRSGSCAILVILVGDDCYTVNIGDSRAFLSKNHGKTLSHLSRDHKPVDLKEQKRVLENGGKIYRTEMTRMDRLAVTDKSQMLENEFIIGPLRVFPGKLSVTRTFGDIEAKDKDFQGIPNCVSAEPEIAKFKLSQSDDFIFMGCDGIFQKLQSVEVNKIIWQTLRKGGKSNLSCHQMSGECVDSVLRESMKRKGTDNLTGILICLKQKFWEKSESEMLIKDSSCRSL